MSLSHFTLLCRIAMVIAYGKDKGQDQKILYRKPQDFEVLYFIAPFVLINKFTTKH
jgi:hypothetical protein